MKTPPAPPQLPPLPQPPRSPVARAGIVMLCCYFFYATILSDSGLLLALLRDVRHAHDTALWEAWLGTVRLPILFGGILGVLVYDFIRCCCKRLSWGEWGLTLLGCWFVLTQLGILNVSPLD